MNDIKQEILDTAVKAANGIVGPDVKIHYFSRDTESGNARIVIYTADDAYGQLVCVGSPRECLQYVNGFNMALGITQ